MTAQVLWLFKKRLRFGLGEEVEEEEQLVAHIQVLDLVPALLALGKRHPCLDLLDKVGIKFSDPERGRSKCVIPFAAIKGQVSVCCFRSDKGDFLGLKVV